MRIKAKLSAVKQTRWHEMVLRFAFGGVVTAIAGMISTRFGAVIGGLFLAFPSIFPASITLVAQHEKKKKMQKTGKDGTRRGMAAAAVDAAGASVGSLALIVFAMIVWRWLPGHSAALVIAAATVSWLVAAVGLWLIWKTRWARKVESRMRETGSREQASSG